MKPLVVIVVLAGMAWVAACQACTLSDDPGDPRVRQVIYRADDVVEIEAQRGFATHISLDPHEQIEVAAPGDRDGWQIVANRGDHDVYLKPKLAAHDSNLEIRTDKRSYSFDLHVLPIAKVGARASHSSMDAVYRLSFAYLDELHAASKADTEATQLAQRLAQAPIVRNDRYSMQAMPDSDDIAPSGAWDDGRFTYLRIPNNRRIPAVFRVADDGTESVVDKHMENDVIVIHEVAKRFVLRLGGEAVGIWNDAYDMDGVPPKDGTTVSGVKRVMSGAADSNHGSESDESDR